MLKKAMLLLWLPLATGLARPDDAKLYVELGQSEGINTVSFSPDGRFVLTADGGGPARLWDVQRGEEIKTFDSGGPEYALFSPDGHAILTADAGQGSSMHLWDITSGAELKTFGADNRFARIALSRNGRKILTGVVSSVTEPDLQLWDVATGKPEKNFYGLNAILGPKWVAFSPDGRFVLAGGDTRTVVWNAATGVKVWEFKSDWKLTDSIQFSSDGRYLLAAKENDAVLVDWKTGTEALRFKGHSNAVMCAAFSPDGQYILTGSHDKTARLWNAKTGAEVRRFEGHGKAILSVAFSPDGRNAVTGSADFSARLWNVQTGEEVKRFQSIEGRIFSIAFSPDGHYFLAGDDNIARLWDLSAGGVVRNFKGHSDRVTSVAFSHDGAFVLTGSDDKTARLWDLNTGFELHRFDGRSGVNAVAVSSDNHFVLTAEDKIARLWNLETGAEIRDFGEEDNGSAQKSWTEDLNQISSVAISSDARYVLTATYNKTVRLLDVANGQEIKHFENLAFNVNTVAVSPEGKYMLIASSDNNAKLLDIATGKEVADYGSSGAVAVPSAAFSPDGRYVLDSSSLNDAWLHEARPEKLLHSLDGHSSAITSMAFAPNGQFIATSSYDHTVRLWETATGRWAATLISFQDYWAVVDPAGRFDTNNLDGGAPLHWTLSDAPLRPLPLEVFMRDYYTPRLLSLVFNRRPLRAIPSISEIKNRVQPEVKIEDVQLTPGNPNRADVRVRAQSHVEKAQASGLQDLRLFRDGQLVGYREGALADGAFVFKNVQLPVLSRKAVFTAYAFNQSRIKSSTVQRDFEYEPQGPHRPKAFLVQIGVNHYLATGCDLRYAANDARKIGALMKERFEARGLEVEATQLVSTDAASAETAAKDRIRQTFAGIAEQATPDDIFFLSFSGHGYADKVGQFYILPSDIAGSCITPDSNLIRNAISADELAAWLRPIDAGEMVFVLDSCYSAKSVEANDFRPGPMGIPGLGQLAYDKRMRILAASQSDEQALEDSQFEQGILSYALTEEGLVQGRADWRPKDKQITMGEWLGYAVDEVPKLYEHTSTVGKGRSALVEEAPQSQIPAVFDFSKTDQFVIQK